MSGTEALSELDTYLNDLYNKYVDEDEDELAMLVDSIRYKLDDLYTKHLSKGD